MTYLNAQQLADLIGCAKNSFSCMRRWLDRNNWPYAISISGFPKVSIEYHNSRMKNFTTTSAAQEPDFGALA